MHQKADGDDAGRLHRRWRGGRVAGVVVVMVMMLVVVVVVVVVVVLAAERG